MGRGKSMIISQPLSFNCNIEDLSFFFCLKIGIKYQLLNFIILFLSVEVKVCLLELAVLSKFNYDVNSTL